MSGTRFCFFHTLLMELECVGDGERQWRWTPVVLWIAVPLSCLPCHGGIYISAYLYKHAAVECKGPWFIFCFKREYVYIIANKCEEPTIRFWMVVDFYGWIIFRFARSGDRMCHQLGELYPNCTIFFCWQADETLHLCNIQWFVTCFICCITLVQKECRQNQFELGHTFEQVNKVGKCMTLNGNKGQESTWQIESLWLQIGTRRPGNLMATWNITIMNGDSSEETKGIGTRSSKKHWPNSNTNWNTINWRPDDWWHPSKPNDNLKPFDPKPADTVQKTTCRNENLWHQIGSSRTTWNPLTPKAPDIHRTNSLHTRSRCCCWVAKLG